MVFFITFIRRNRNPQMVYESNVFSISSSSFMNGRVEIFPQIVHRMIFFQFRCPDKTFDSFFFENFIVFVKNNCGNPFILVFRANAN